MLATFGDELRREREVRGIELREVAEATKVNLRFLEALERNDFALLPGGLFTRGFIRAYATHIGADPDKLVNAYLFQVSGPETSARPYRPRGGDRTPPAAGDAPSPPRKARRGWRWFAGAVFLASVPAVLLFLRPATWTPAPAGADPTVPRQFELKAMDATRVRAWCGDAVRLDLTLSAGERAGFRCAGRIVLQASDGGSLRVSLDGADLGPPGTSGAPLETWEAPGS
jgi:transcriptional regulator with XRE-family HTH domain